MVEMYLFRFTYSFDLVLYVCVAASEIVHFYGCVVSFETTHFLFLARYRRKIYEKENLINFYNHFCIMHVYVYAYGLWART